MVTGVFDNTIPFTFGPNGDLVTEDGSLVVPVDDPIPDAIYTAGLNIPEVCNRYNLKGSQYTD